MARLWPVDLGRPPTGLPTGDRESERCVRVHSPRTAARCLRPLEL